MACKILVPQLGFKLMSSAVKVKVPTTGLPGSAPCLFIYYYYLKKYLFGCTSLGCGTGDLHSLLQRVESSSLTRD